MEQVLAGGQLRAHRVGKGRPIVLLHSLLADAASWDGLVPILSRRFEVIVFDLPGFAGLPAVIGGLAPIAGVLNDGIVALELAEPPIVIGNGFGSFLALRLALDHPDRVAALVLIGCGIRFSEPGRAAFRAMREAAACGLGVIADTAMARLFGAAFRALNPALMAARRDAFLRTDPAMFAAACAALETLDLDVEIDRVTVETLIMVGSEDQATPPAMAENLARRLRFARLELLDGLAHVPQLQEPTRLGAIIAAFVTEQQAVLF